MSILRVTSLGGPLPKALESFGTLFRSFTEQDSGCVSYGLATPHGRVFIKHPTTPRAALRIEVARRLHERFTHPALPALRHTFHTPTGTALVLDWRDGELLYLGQAARPPHDINAHARFLGLLGAERHAALRTLLEVHVMLEASGVLATDLYDGSLLYDFQSTRLTLVDLDEYREDGPFTLEADRLPGSRRLMAPEEFQRGARIDFRTNVFTLGRLLQTFLEGALSREQSEVLQRATQPAPDARWNSISALHAAWIATTQA